MDQRSVECGGLKPHFKNPGTDTSRTEIAYECNRVLSGSAQRCFKIKKSPALVRISGTTNQYLDLLDYSFGLPGNQILG